MRRSQSSEKGPTRGQIFQFHHHQEFYPGEGSCQSGQKSEGQAGNISLSGTEGRGLL